MRLLRYITLIEFVILLTLLNPESAVCQSIENENHISQYDSFGSFPSYGNNDMPDNGSSEALRARPNLEDPVYFLKQSTPGPVADSLWFFFLLVPGYLFVIRKRFKTQT